MARTNTWILNKELILFHYHDIYLLVLKIGTKDALIDNLDYMSLGNLKTKELNGKLLTLDIDWDYWTSLGLINSVSKIKYDSFWMETGHKTVILW